MSSLSQVQVEQIEKISPHFNADSLELLELSNGFTVVDKIGKFIIGERVAYSPVDMKYVGPNPEEYAFLDKGRVRGKKIRGIISCGLALKLEDQTLELSTDLSDQYHFVPYEAPEPHRPGASLGKSGNELKPPVQMSKYDIESIRKYHKVFSPEIVVTEKIHGAFSAYLYHTEQLRSLNNSGDTVLIDGESKFYCKTRTRWLEHDGKHAWSWAANKHNLEEKLKNIPNLVVCGEVYGNVQDLKYGHSQGDVSFAAFDIWHTGWNKFLDYDHFVSICDANAIPRVPEIYRGPWISLDHIKELSERKTALGSDRNQIAEGVVVKYTHESYSPSIGRVILKLPSDSFLTRK